MISVSSSPIVKDDVGSVRPVCRPSLKAKKRWSSAKLAKRFSRRVLPAVAGMLAEEGKQRPRTPELPVAERPRSWVLLAMAVEEWIVGWVEEVWE